MIRVFFNIRLDETFLPERTGQWVADAGEARDIARVIVRRLVADHGGEPRLLNAAMAVTTEDGALLFDLSFFEALYVPVASPEPEAQPLRRAAAVRARPRLSPARLRAALLRLRTDGLALGADLRIALARVSAWALRRGAAAQTRFRLGFEPSA